MSYYYAIEQIEFKQMNCNSVSLLAMLIFTFYFNVIINDRFRIFIVKNAKLKLKTNNKVGKQQI